MLIFSLHEFHEGTIAAGGHARGNNNPMHPASRFYFNSLFAYLHAYYCAKGALLLKVLKEVGRSDLAESITAILDRDVGSAKFREVISANRNKGLAHPVFNFSDFRRTLVGDSRLGADAYRQLQRRTVALHVLLRKLYPEASQALDAAQT